MAFFLLVAAFVLVFVWQRQVLVARSSETIASVVEVQAKQIGAYVDEGVNYAEFVASLPEVRRSVDPPRVGPGTTGMERDLQTLVAAWPDVLWLAVYDGQSNLVVATGTASDLPETALVAKAVATDFSGVIAETSTGPVHLVGVSVGPEGSSDGVVIVAQSLLPVHEVVSVPGQLGETGESAVLAGGEGGFLPFTPTRFELEDSSGSFFEGEYSPDVDSAEDQRAFSAVDYRGNAVLANDQYLPGPEWAVVAKVDRTEAFAPLASFSVVGLFVLLFGSLLAGFLAWQVAQRIRAPIVEMKDAAVAVAAGEREILVPNGRVDEIGELADAFNSMTAEMNLLAENLEVEVASRTAQLEQANAELRAIMEAKETFLVGVSHEVRGPLTAMMGFLSLANSPDAPADSSRTAMLDSAMEHADEVLLIVEDLLAGARVETGSMRTVSVRVDLGAQVRQVVEGLNPTDQSVVEFTGESVAALADPSRTRQVARNLITNAFRYGGQRVRINTSRHRDRVRLRVEDDGDGVPTSERAKIFEAFGQVADGRLEPESVGIGLHVSRQLAEIMHGTLTYDFRDGWSVFTLDLPAFQDEMSVQVSD